MTETKIKIPNKKTIKDIKEARARKNMQKISLDDLKRELEKKISI